MTYTDTTPSRTCSRQDLELIDAYWRAANYLSVRGRHHYAVPHGHAQQPGRFRLVTTPANTVRTTPRSPTGPGQQGRMNQPQSRGGKSNEG